MTVGLFSQKGSFTVEKLWESPDLLTTCESVCYDDSEKVLYAACINGKPLDKDGNGFIAKLSLTGDIMLLKWTEGLNAPKGMGIANNSLYVTDIDRVIKFELKSGNMIKEYKVEGAGFLNDIAVDKNNNVYITDMSSNNIYWIHKDQIKLWISDEAFIKPNGLNVEENKLLVGTRNGIYTVDLEGKSLKHYIKNTGGIDGLEPYGNGFYIISDWSGKVQVVHADKEPVVLFNTSDKGINAADIHYLPDRNLLLVPTFFDNRVTAYYVFGEKGK